jgi:hypothetical protein
MDNRDSQKALGATESKLRLADYPLGSWQSRAAARAMLERRKASEEEGLRFQVVSIVDGSLVAFDKLAETIQHG